MRTPRKKRRILNASNYIFSQLCLFGLYCNLYFFAVKQIFSKEASIVGKINMDNKEAVEALLGTIERISYDDIQGVIKEFNSLVNGIVFKQQRKGTKITIEYKPRYLNHQGVNWTYIVTIECGARNKWFVILARRGRMVRGANNNFGGLYWTWINAPEYVEHFVKYFGKER